MTRRDVCTERKSVIARKMTRKLEWEGKREREGKKMSDVRNLAEQIQKCQSEIPLASREAR